MGLGTLQEHFQMHMHCIEISVTLTLLGGLMRDADTVESVLRWLKDFELLDFGSELRNSFPDQLQMGLLRRSRLAYRSPISLELAAGPAFSELRREQWIHLPRSLPKIPAQPARHCACGGKWH